MTFPRRQLDGTAVREMYETTVELSETHNLKLLIDLTDIPLISSGVMGMLVTMRKRLLHTGGQMHIAAPDPNVFQSFHVMNLHLVLTLFEDPARAAAAFKP
jgi:anti-anti-sigma factor